MTSESIKELLESIRGVALDIITYDAAHQNDHTYKDLRQNILDSFGNKMLPSLVNRHRTGRELRTTSQGFSTYRERRSWFNADMNEKLDEIESLSAPLIISTPLSSIILPVTSEAPNLDAEFPTHVHFELVERCRSHFISGDFDTCLLNAFRYIEVRIRELGGFAPTDIGVSLISKAMSSKSGMPIIKLSDVESEQEGYHSLFRGAIASFKNPLSHKEVGHNNSVRACEMVSFASLLLGLLDSAEINI